MSAPVENNGNTNSTIYIAEYTYNDKVYAIHTTMDEHYKLSTDQNFLKTYLGEYTKTSETAAAAVDNTETDLIMENNTSNICTSEDLNFKWSHKTTQLLLQSYRERVLKFRDPKVKKKHYGLRLWQYFSSMGMRLQKKY